jgi:hypothetical protein
MPLTREILHKANQFKELVIVLMLCLSALCGFAQSSKTAKKSVAPTKKPAKYEAATSQGVPTKNLPEYYTEYAHGGDFRNGKVVTQDEQEAFAYILPIPILLNSQGDEIKSMQLWKDAVRKSFQQKNNKVAYKNDVEETGNTPQLVADPLTSASQTDKEGASINLPAWVAPYLENDIDFNKLYQYQYKVGNVLFCDSLNSIPYLINSEPKTQVEKMKEADKYYNVLFWWSSAYPELFYNLDDSNFLQALSQKNKEVIYHYGFYRFLLNDTLKEGFKSKDKMVKKS